MDNFFNLQFEELEDELHALSQPSFRAKQIWEGAYQHLLASWQYFTNLPKDLRTFLENRYALTSLTVLDETTAPDQQSTKYLFSLPDGNYIESVILRSGDRITLCVSTQSGCPVGCAFCATGKFGFFRDLTAGEIVEQVIFLSRLLEDKNEHINNIVLMGMGEPFLNYDATLKAVKRFNDNAGMNIGARRITISTIGIPEKILLFAQEGLQVNLAVSLHAPNDTLRCQLVPLAAKVHISDIMQACHQYIKATNRRVTFEYVLIADVNDQPQQAEELAALLQGMLCHVNLIGLNPTEHYHGGTPSHKAMSDFGKVLLSHNIPTSIRNSQGSDIQAACGQLAGKVRGSNKVK
jgi:23S rRNA (adenine2503-C2)-methyltransferase